MSKGALETVVLRNAFYRDNYKRAIIALLLLLVVNCVLGAAIFYRYTHPTQPQYFATTPDGRLINMHPLSDPVVSDSYVLQWTAAKVREAFSQDYIHWRQQLQDVSSAFTPGGWQYFLQSMKSSNNLKTLVALKMVSNAEITGAPTITQKAVINGHYAWKIQIPIVVTYANNDKTIPMPMEVTVIVLRMSVKDYPQRIAINNFLPKVTSRQASQGLF